MIFSVWSLSWILLKKSSNEMGRTAAPRPGRLSPALFDHRASDPLILDHPKFARWALRTTQNRDGTERLASLILCLIVKHGPDAGILRPNHNNIAYS
jgi:hypothetical protein